jgi:elongation factor G
VSVYDGKFHAVDSKEIAFVTAGKKAFLDAVDKAKAAVLEPIVKIQIIAPNNNMGDLTGDLSTKRGRINGSEALSNNRVAIMGEVPLAELDGYDARLKSITGGEGTYSIDFSHYDPVPGNIQKDLAAAYQRKED